MKTLSSSTIFLNSLIFLPLSDFDVHSGAVLRCVYPERALDAVLSPTSVSGERANERANIADLMLPEGAHKRQWVTIIQYFYRNPTYSQLTREYY